jgi:hypothetical protein
MSLGSTLVLSSGPKLHENLLNNEIGNEVYINYEFETMVIEEKIKIAIIKTSKN